MKTNWLSVYLLAPTIAWLFAQALKAALDLSNKRVKSKESMFRSGGMPSTHSAAVVALLTVIGARLGTDSPLFALAFILAAIVMYDAINVRRSVGEQADVLAEVAKGKRFYVAYGHTVKEVAVGATLGLLVALAVLQIL